MEHKFLGRELDVKQAWILGAVAALVALTGLITISSTLDALIHLRYSRIVGADAHITLLAGLSLLYLATLLRRGKRTAWLLAIPIFVFLLARNIRHFDYDLSGRENYDALYFLNLLLPLVILAILVFGRQIFSVRSEIRSFTSAFRRSIFILLVAFFYGVIGFQFLDKRDFHQEISLPASAHYTIDQFGLSTNNQLSPYTRRAHLFLDSLAAISLGSLFYVSVALFSPIRFRLVSHQTDFEDVKTLLKKYPANSEDFFKLWPRDKAYVFSALRQAVIAYRTVGGVALAVGDPIGNQQLFKDLMSDFRAFCYLNGWRPAFIHTLPDHLDLYTDSGLEVQKIGEEAIVDLNNFTNNIVTNKYFRHISNKFIKQGYRCEMLLPPHSASVIQRLREISDDWLNTPGRSERGFMMGYFDEEYLQQCRVMVARDSADAIRAFINQLPALNKNEASYDFIRHTRGSPSNINDFVMINFTQEIKKAGFVKLNMGLCPLSGLDEASEINRSLVDNLLNLVYANSSRFYSFQGLRRFKEKYEPQWRSRFIVYEGGVVGLTRTANSLVRAMRLEKPSFGWRPDSKNRVK